MSETIALEDYETVKLLGEGGMGSVHLVRHRPTGELRVAKLVHGRWQGDARFEARLEREARLLSRLQHAHIARLLEADLQPGSDAILIMEHIDGIGLDQLLRRLGRFPVGDAVLIARQLAGALAHLHAQGWIHRDISPDNVMVGWRRGQAHATLIDLGIAKSLAGASVELTATGGFIGKVRYSSPEQLTAGGELDPRSDLYAFGIVCYEMLTGRSPIEGDGADSLVAGHLLHPPRPFDDRDADVPPALRRLVMSMLAKKPRERPPSAQTVRAALETIHLPEPTAELRALVGEPGDTTLLPGEEHATATLPLHLRRTPPSEAAPGRRRRLGPAALAGAAVVGAVAVAGALLFLPGPQAPDQPQPAASTLERPAEDEELRAVPSAQPGEAARADESPPRDASPAPGDGRRGDGSQAAETPLRPAPATDGEGRRAAAGSPRLEDGAVRDDAVRDGAVRDDAVRDDAVPDTGPRAMPEQPAQDGEHVEARGLLVLDATPWAELIALRRADGSEVPLPEERTTPMAMSLHPGIYEVTLSHPESRQALRTTIEVEPDAIVRRHLELPSLTVDDFLRDLGW